MFSSPTSQAQDDISADSIGSQHEQKYFQDEHSGHSAASYPYDSYSTYYESMFADAHEAEHHQSPHSGYPERDNYGWEQDTEVDLRH